MDSEDGCSICMRRYTKVVRKEMMLCANNHFICLDCSKRISQRNSLCPFCKLPFDIKAIEPRRTVSEEPQPERTREKERGKGKESRCSVCSQGHGNFTSLSATCRVCEEEGRGRWSCHTCGYVICKTCIERREGGRAEPRQARVYYEEVRYHSRQDYSPAQERTAKKENTFGQFVLMVVFVVFVWIWKNRG